MQKDAMKGKIIIIAAILVGAWVGNRIKLPSGYLTGGLILGLVVKGIVGGNVPYGGPISIVLSDARRVHFCRYVGHEFDRGTPGSYPHRLGVCTRIAGIHHRSSIPAQ